MKISYEIYFFVLIIVLIISCKGIEKENSDFILTDKVVLIAKNTLHADTLIFAKAGIVNYIHTGIGVKFSGVYRKSNGKISVRILDYENQYKEDVIKEVVAEFDIVRQNNHLFIKNIKKQSQLFDKVAISSNVRFASK